VFGRIPVSQPSLAVAIAYKEKIITASELFLLATEKAVGLHIFITPNFASSPETAIGGAGRLRD